jgi:hypothetical protein
VNGVVYGDWFLPSKGELNQMYVNKTAIGGGSGIYWSSSEDAALIAWNQSFYDGDGHQDNYPKPDTYYVRPVRAF